MTIFFFYSAEQIQEAVLYCKLNDIRPHAEIEDPAIIRDIVAKFGYKIRFVPHPNREKPIEIVSFQMKAYFYFVFAKICES